MRNRLKKYLLLALLACDGLPMPESALISAAQNLSRPETPTRSDVMDALTEVERDHYAAGLTEDMTGERTWTLTTKGIHKARQLR